MRHLLFALALLLPMVLGSCKTRQGGGLAKQLSPETREIATQWKADAFGCTKYRTADKAENLVAALMPIKPTRAEIEELLGKAEMENSNGGRLLLGWYFDGACENGRLKAATVYCLFQVYVVEETGKMESGGVICG